MVVGFTLWYSRTSDSEHVQSTVPSTTSQYTFIVQRPSATHDKLGVRIMDIKKLRLSRCRVRAPPRMSNIEDDRRESGRYIHSTRHIITRRRKYVRPVRTPLHLPHRILMSPQLHLTRPPHHRTTLHTPTPTPTHLHHPTIPYPHHLIHTSARKHPRTVLVPIQTQNFSRGRGYGECGC
jgi:hypothetical protein